MSFFSSIRDYISTHFTEEFVERMTPVFERVDYLQAKALSGTEGVVIEDINELQDELAAVFGLSWDDETGHFVPLRDG